MSQSEQQSWRERIARALAELKDSNDLLAQGLLAGSVRDRGRQPTGQK
jgi:hypothetical protein